MMTRQSPWQYLETILTDYKGSFTLQLFQGRTPAGEELFLLFDPFPSGLVAALPFDADSAAPIPGFDEPETTEELSVSAPSALASIVSTLNRRAGGKQESYRCRSACVLSERGDRIIETAPILNRIPFLASALPGPEASWEELARAANRFWILEPHSLSGPGGASPAAQPGPGLTPAGSLVILDTQGRAVFVRERAGGNLDSETFLYGEAVGRPVWMRDGITETLAERIETFFR